MKLVLQRALAAQVTVDGKVTGSIDKGLVILLCAEQNDTEEACRYLARKCVELRIFADAEGKMNKSLMESAGKVLLISQFTLAADWRKGRRPGFTKAASPQEGKRLYEFFGQLLEEMGVAVSWGVFGADMKVTLTNDGPVTLILEEPANQSP
ncbi:MAG: D-tyrosyl-tRNA(Tyr) deacylase [Candidatus Obscuribacterales bacterium]|nr:D-tyrosyl-tRNA(Tyr) deacylase [Candidatus Obscuribacterales bacterium]